ncbi:14936_t:CDS:2 [Acaulospora morrowiae]|uniref:14936_t:CDS:1 n=1 Tax=Acaulospora morrowiae TaxID=94023 RepID=A0A9N9AGF5_9GLOM|nr:14936_t:CDS:2 [Acaulospora morrowiae]
MRATFAPRNLKPKSKVKNSTGSQIKKRLRKQVLFRATFYQVICDHNPNIIALEEEDFVEYLSEQVWDLGILDDSKVKNGNETGRNSKENSSTLTEQEIITRIFEIVKDDFITFEVCNDEEQCLEICKDIVVKWKSVSNPSASAETSLPGTCTLCHRHMPLTFHHLIPRMMHKRVLKKGLFTKEECTTRGIDICRPCHSAIHKMISNDQLALKYNTLEMLLEHEGVVKFVGWASKQKGYSKDHIRNLLRFPK